MSRIPAGSIISESQSITRPARRAPRAARRVAGAGATAFIAVMTAAFAIGQIVGPILVSALAHRPHGFTIALLAAAAVLRLAAISLWRSSGSEARA
ncbi:MAG: YbfB/YjiJ family MFS transporter [Gammaproteobacteria bacterium]|nr:YbfB/YjiJ family MFS transporter [Gammaproteobacteria bacterium]